MRLVKLIVLGTIAMPWLTHISGQANPSTAPTLAETVSFIKDHVNQEWTFHDHDSTYGDTVWFIKQRANFLSKRGDPVDQLCVLDFFRSQGRADGAAEPKNERHTVDAGKLLLRDISSSGWYQPDGGPRYGTVALHLSSEPVGTSREIDIYVENTEMAERVANAFRGLGKLCGAKEEAY